jgi:heat shock 70kDa protein 1/2/6/8
MDEEIIIGIDLGTTNSCVSVWKDNRLVVIPDEFGYNTIPSVVSFTNSDIYIGREAQKQKKINPKNTFYDIKRLIGKNINDINVQNDIEFLNFPLYTDNNQNIKIDINKKKYKLEYISSFILRKLKTIAENFLNKKIKKAVITVPAYFNNNQRQSTLNSARIADLECVRIINEPTSSSLAYGYNNIINKEEMNILVYDLGGGTLDISILNICDGVFEVLSSTGNTHLGGEDFDNKLFNYSLNSFKSQYKLNEMKVSTISLSKLKLCCENAKKTLSNYHDAIIGVKNFYDNKDLVIKISRKKFEELCNDLFTLCLSPVYNSFKNLDIKKSEIDEIILVGGSTKIPKIKSSIEMFFGRKINFKTNPDEIVAMGAAIQGYILANNGESPFSNSVVLLDSTTLSLGIETTGGVMNTIIPRNSILPARKKKLFTTDEDDSNSVDIKIYEGERSMTKDNFFIGRLELDEIQNAKRGVPKIEISFSIDTNNIIVVNALDLNSNRSKELRIINKNKLDDLEIEKLIEESKKYKANDLIKKNIEQTYHEIMDMCSNILNNIKSDFNTLNNNDKNKIKEDVNKIIEKMNILDSNKDKNMDEYDKILERIKRNYSTMILQVIEDEEMFKGVEKKNISATTLFDDDEEEIEYLNLDNKSNKDRKLIKELKDGLLENCNFINEIFSDNDIDKDNCKIKELKDYVEDTLLWIYVKENITVEDLNNRNDKINEISNNCVDNNLINLEYSKKTELEELCYSLKSSINGDMFNLESDIILSISNLVDETLEWLVKNINEKLNEEEYEERIYSINNLCNSVYE